jgi:hypothetical protein
LTSRLLEEVTSNDDESALAILLGEEILETALVELQSHLVRNDLEFFTKTLVGNVLRLEAFKSLKGFFAPIAQQEPSWRLSGEPDQTACCEGNDEDEAEGNPPCGVGIHVFGSAGNGRHDQAADFDTQPV